MTLQDVDWYAVGAIIVWVGSTLLFIAIKITRNLPRLRKDFKTLFDKVWNSDDPKAILDLFIFIFECITTLGGAKNVRNVLEASISDGGCED